MALSTQWIWVWANSGRQWRTEKPGVLQSMGSQSVGHDLAIEQQKPGNDGWSSVMFFSCFSGLALQEAMSLFYIKSVFLNKVKTLRQIHCMVFFLFSTCIGENSSFAHLAFISFSKQNQHLVCLKASSFIHSLWILQCREVSQRKQEEDHYTSLSFLRRSIWRSEKESELANSHTKFTAELRLDPRDLRIGWPFTPHITSP